MSRSQLVVLGIVTVSLVVVAVLSGLDYLDTASPVFPMLFVVGFFIIGAVVIRRPK